jgi:hypothetical protein
MYNIIELKNQLNFGNGRDRNGRDFRILSSSNKVEQQYDVLIFTDSKGSDFSGKLGLCWTDRIIETIESKKLSYLFISRPKDITIFFTLINFLRLNNIKFKNLITNLGYVEHTPLKKINVDDIKIQSPNLEFQTNILPRPLQMHTIFSGETTMIYAYEYGDIEELIARELDKYFDYAILIGVMDFSHNIKTKRKRPDSFFKQLKVSNKFIFEISQNSAKLHFVLPIKKQIIKEDLFSHDAVHFTSEGHFRNFEILKPYVEANIKQ